MIHAAVENRAFVAQAIDLGAFMGASRSYDHGAQVDRLAAMLGLRPATARQTARASPTVVALHEAAHATAALALFPKRLLYIEMAPAGEVLKDPSLKHQQFRGCIYLRTILMDTDDLVYAELVELLAGASGECLTRVKSCGYRVDVDIAWYIAMRHYRDAGRVAKVLMQARSEAETLLTKHKPLWERITQGLLEKRKLGGGTPNSRSGHRRF